MKHDLRGGVAALLMVALAIGSAPSAVAAPGDIITDPALQSCTRRVLAAAKLPTDLTTQNVAKLAQLSCNATDDGVVRDLAGLAAFTGLTRLVLREDAVTDFAPIADLPLLQSVVLGVGEVGDLGFLSGRSWQSVALFAAGTRLPELPAFQTNRFGAEGGELTSLDGLGSMHASTVWIQNTPRLVDVSGLAGATIQDLVLHVENVRATTGLEGVQGLKTLEISSTALDDVSGVSAQQGLTSVALSSDRLADLSPMAGLPRLTSLTVSSPVLSSLGAPGALKGLTSLTVQSSQVTSLDALRGATSLQVADLDGNQISDISALAHLPLGASIGLADNRVSDISALAHLPAGVHLDLQHNRISDISPLSSAAAGDTINLDDNRIADFSPMKGWSGHLTALGQQIELPDAVAEIPFVLPFSLLDAGGQPLVAHPGNAMTYDNGKLTYPEPLRESWRIWSSFHAGSPDDSPISVELVQTVTPGEPFTTTGITFPGDPVVDVPFAPVLPRWQPTPDDITYQWYNARVGPIAGATGPTYTPTLSDVPGTLMLKVTAHRPGYAWTDVLSLWSGQVRLNQLTSTPKPQILYHGRRVTDPLIKVKATASPELTVAPGSWDPGVELTYEWLSGEHPIPGATAATYRLTPSDIGEYLTVRVTGSRPGYVPIASESKFVIFVGGKFTAESPVVTGARRVGQTLTVTRSWPADTYLECRWYRDGHRIPNATRASHRLTAADLGHRLRVRVTASKSGYTNRVFTTARTAKIAPGILTHAPIVVSGTGTPGRILTVLHGTWGPGTVTYAYRWYRDGTAIAHATGRKYLVLSADSGHALSVRVTVSKRGYVTARTDATPDAGERAERPQSAPR